ncbi:hypothetical protein J6Y73_03070 [bacterium]|nr:hypothetical protein [bacterium]
MENKKVIFVYNPSAGKGKVEKNIDFIKNAIKEKFGLLDIHRSTSNDDFQKTIKEACKSYDYILFSGGDGTFNMTINAIPLDLPNLPIFGYLPGGSTNDMGYNVNISKKIKEGIYDLLNASPIEYNIGTIGDHKFIYVADFGAFTNVSHITPAETKRKFGRLAYLKYAIQSIKTTVKPHRIIVDGVVYHTPLMIISNSREVGSFKINPEKEQNDGLYYIVIVKNGRFNGFFNIIYLFAFGLEQAIKKNKVISFQSPLFKLDCDYEDWDVDGEYIKLKFPLTCGYSRKKIRILTNR